jgi:O-antigen/teichoic acid export membrane protein
MAKSSLKVNTMLYGTKVLLSVIFPLITFPYISRILQVSNLGKVNFGSSIINYFVLIAALGISSYAIREGSGLRENKEKLSDFANQMFTINMISSVISYIFLFTLLAIVPKLNNYSLLLAIQSIVILANTFGIEWLYSIYEDYLYITVRSIIFQIISMILMFTFVKNVNDYYIYAIILVFSSAGSNILNFIHSRKFLKLKFTKKIDFKKHLRPIMILFSNNIAITIYVSLDITILGFLVGDYAVGLYSISVKIYSVFKLLLQSIVIVSLPRLSSYLSNKDFKNYNLTIGKIINGISLLILPTVVGINLLCNQLILIISDKSYIDANTSLHILSIALLFSAFATFTSTAVLLPMKKEKYILIATGVSAIINVISNIFLIPLFQQNGAAATTALSELVVLAVTFSQARKYFKIEGFTKNLITSLAGCIAIVLVSLTVRFFITETLLFTIITGVSSIIVYFLVLLALGNDLILSLTRGIIMKIKRVY